MQTKIGKIDFTQLGQQSYNALVAQLAKFTPNTNSNNFVGDAMKQWVDGANKAMEAVAKATSQMAEFATSKAKAAQDVAMDMATKSNGNKKL